MFPKYCQLFSSSKGNKKAKNFFFRSLLYYPITLKWLKFIDSFYQKYDFSSAPIYLATIANRSTLSKNLNSIYKIIFIERHYLIIEYFFNQDFIKSILTENQKIKITSLQNKDNNDYAINLVANGDFFREGALTLYLQNNKLEIISRLSFTIYEDACYERSIIIGGFDIESVEENKENFESEFYKIILLECFYIMASRFGVEKIIGVSDNNHILSSKKNFIRKYNKIWQDLGGSLRKDGNYTLPKSFNKTFLKNEMINFINEDKFNLDIEAFFKKNLNKNI